MKTLLFITLIMVSTACGIQKNNFKFGRIRFMMDLPKNYTVVKSGQYTHNTYYDIHYGDGSIIYINNDEKSGGGSYDLKVKKYGEHINLYIRGSDTLNLEGMDENGNYWREYKLIDVVYGYLNVPSSKKEVYDHVLETVVRKQKRDRRPRYR